MRRCSQGGPVQTERGFVLHEPICDRATRPDESVYASTMTIPGGLEMTTSKDVLEALSTGRGPAQGAGHAGLFGLGRGPAGIRAGRKQLADRGRRHVRSFSTRRWSSATTARSAAGPGGLDAVARGGALLAFDFGLKRTGVASGNRLLRTAQPAARSRPRATPALAIRQKSIAEWQPDALVVGVPFHPDGASHDNTRRAQRFARQLHGRFRPAGARGGRALQHHRGAGRRRADADAAAACIILEQFLRNLESDTDDASARRRGAVHRAARGVRGLLRARCRAGGHLVGRRLAGRTAAGRPGPAGRAGVISTLHRDDFGSARPGRRRRRHQPAVRRSKAATSCWSTTCCTPAAPSAPWSTSCSTSAARPACAGGAGGPRRARAAGRRPRSPPRASCCRPRSAGAGA
jgi:putative Holliday junction resolvase